MLKSSWVCLKTLEQSYTWLPFWIGLVNSKEKTRRTWRGVGRWVGWEGTSQNWIFRILTTISLNKMTTVWSENKWPSVQRLQLPSKCCHAPTSFSQTTGLPWTHQLHKISSLAWLSYFCKWGHPSMTPQSHFKLICLPHSSLAVCQQCTMSLPLSFSSHNHPLLLILKANILVQVIIKTYQ